MDVPEFRDFSRILGPVRTMAQISKWKMHMHEGVSYGYPMICCILMLLNRTRFY